MMVVVVVQCTAPALPAAPVKARHLERLPTGGLLLLIFRLFPSWLIDSHTHTHTNLDLQKKRRQKQQEKL